MKRTWWNAVKSEFPTPCCCKSLSAAITSVKSSLQGGLWAWCLADIRAPRCHFLERSPSNSQGCSTKKGVAGMQTGGWLILSQAHPDCGWVGQIFNSYGLIPSSFLEKGDRRKEFVSPVPILLGFQKKSEEEQS